ncbi:hypothetical protein [Salipiger mangrovisoli]|uniref:hypothetical protein n=1 Tax=Salipiger mangrovisoli TaxID=2865933 RepID=UPI001F11B8BD|nr:hypothetical protein [Salipiger mangrovisoli]
MPTAHGFDEFFGILYHLNAGEDTEHHDYPKDPPILGDAQQRGIIHSSAGEDGSQRIEDLGGFGAERQKTSTGNPRRIEALHHRRDTGGRAVFPLAQ